MWCQRDAHERCLLLCCNKCSPQAVRQIFLIKDAVGMYFTYIHNGFLRGVKKPYPSCLSAATSAGQISKKHSRDTHVNLFSAQRTACLAGLSDRRLRHKHTSFWMYHKDNAHGSYDSKPAFCDKHHRRLSRMPVCNRCSPGFGVRVLPLPGPMRTRPQDGYLFKGFFMLPEAAR